MVRDLPVAEPPVPFFPFHKGFNLIPVMAGKLSPRNPAGEDLKDLVVIDRVKAQVQQLLSTLKLYKSRFRPFTTCLDQ